MKKRVISFLLVAMTIFSLIGTAFAATPRASDYLNNYTVALRADGSGVMTVGMSVEGVGIQEKIGVREVMVEKKINGVWTYQESLDSVDHPEFYAYNSRDYLGSVTYKGTPGVSYRVTLTVYARSGTGSDTGYVTSPVVVCK